MTTNTLDFRTLVRVTVNEDEVSEFYSEDDAAGEEEQFPSPIPGTRRLGNSKLGRSSRVHRNSSVSSAVLALYSPRNNQNDSAVFSSPRLLPGSTIKNAEDWDAEAFRIKRREAQKAIETLPRYSAAIRNNTGGFEQFVAESIAIRLDEEFEEYYLEIVNKRAVARIFVVWLAWANMRKSRKGIPITNTKFEINAGPRILPRTTRDASSSSTTDITRPSEDEQNNKNSGEEDDVDKELNKIHNGEINEKGEVENIPEGKEDEETEVVKDPSLSPGTLNSVYNESGARELKKKHKNQQKSRASIILAALWTASSKFFRKTSQKKKLSS